eukprot:4330467-Lingulodinium_polyedra.AAC.1
MAKELFETFLCGHDYWSGIVTYTHQPSLVGTIENAVLLRTVLPVFSSKPKPFAGKADFVE